MAVVLTLRSQGSRFTEALSRTGIAATVGSLVAALAGLLASALVWRALLTDLGSRLPLRTALHVFFLGQLGKYLPGSVFAVAAQMELGRDQGVSRSRVGTASLLFMGVLTAAGLLVAAVALPLTSPDALRSYFWVLLVLPVGLVCLAPPVLTRLVGAGLRVLRRDPLDRPLSGRGIGAALGWALAMWAAYGIHVLLLLLPQDRTGTGNLPLLALGGYALAWTVGFLFLLAPAGALIRETVLVLALAPVLDRPGATAVAVVSRGVMTLADLLWGGAGALLRPRNRPRKRADGADVVTVTPVKQLGKAADA
ncbi:MAG: lysylphosphatidylglycerol synthase domain-containing protein [Actinobacteria bacterium]|nr:lysylphosphatidylglycerol synthase domain-containing protein [Actinomycetota bacterium]